MRTDANAPRLLLDGIGTWSWDPKGVTDPVPAPRISDGSSVWVTWFNTHIVVCPYCGAYDNRGIEIRDRPDGQILWIAREGPKLTDLDPAIEDQLFGVPATVQTRCAYAGEFQHCYHFQRRVDDHVLATTPATLIPHATLTAVATAKGTYQVFWAHSVNQAVQKTCVDGPDVANDTGFAASRIAP